MARSCCGQGMPSLLRLALLLLPALWGADAAQTQRTVSAAALKRQLLAAAEAGDRLGLSEAVATLEQVQFARSTATSSRRPGD